MSTASAPGKVILFGEHAVVYGQPALAVPVAQVQATVTVTGAARKGVWVEAPNVGLSSELSSLAPDHPLAAAIRAIFSTLAVSRPPACTVYVQSTIPVASGLGSGAAVSIAILRSLSAFLGHPLPPEQVNRLAFEIEKLYHGTPSGIDNTVITYARPVYFVQGQPIERLHPGAAFTLIIADTGISSPTKIVVGDIRSRWEADPERYDKLFGEIGGIVRQARQAIEAGETASLGPLMNRNHELLCQMTASSPELDRLVASARSAGAGGAKLSGGGRGGNMIALVTPENAEKISQVLYKAGARRVLTTTVSKTPMPG